MVICLEQGADCLHLAQLMPLSLTVSCFSTIQNGFTFLVPAHTGSPEKRAVKRVCVYIPHKNNTFNAILQCKCSECLNKQKKILERGNNAHRSKLNSDVFAQNLK